MTDNTFHKLRNLSIIAHIDSGKSSITDCFVSRAGLISDDESGVKRWTDNRPDEKARGITIKSTGVSLKMTFEGTEYSVNIVDSPGHVDFSSEVSAALRITDGAIVVIDAIEGVAVQTETVLRQALAEQVKPILVINKMDRYIFELQLTPEETYNRIATIINNMNNLVSTYQGEDSKLNLDLSPDMGNVFFTSAIHAWGFSLYSFSKLYAKKYNTDEKTFMKKLWGDHFFDPETKKITTESMKNGKPLERTFCKFVLGPIFQMIRLIMNKEVDKYPKMLESVGVTLTPKDLEKPEKEQYKLAMKRWLPIAESLLYGIVNHLPSPKEAQAYRYTSLYDGPLDDECATAIKNCDPNGPLMLYISKMIPMDEGGRFYAFGRVFSGTVSSGQKVRILGANHKFGTNEDVSENKSIQRVVRMIGGKVEQADNIECGNTVALVGVDQYILKSATITTSSAAHPIKTMKFSVNPVVRVSVSPKNPSELPKLVEGLKKLSKSDPCVRTLITEEGEHIVAGVGELHIEICLNDLRDFMKSDIKVSTPIVPLRETVLAKSSQVCLSKSPNKHNRLYMTAEPLDPELVNKLADKEISSKSDPNERGKRLANEFNWDPTDTKKIWTFGPEGDEETNVVVDTAKGVQYLNEIRENVVAGFQGATYQGVLCEEPVRGVRFNVVDVMLHADSIHRGGGQIIPTARRCLCAAMLTATPAIMEPIYLVEIQVPESYVGKVYSCLNHKRGRVTNEEKNPNTPMYVIKGFLPVAESFGFNAYIREQSAGQAFPALTYSHWEVVQGNVFDKSTRAGQMVRETRLRKGLKEDIPDLNDYLDKL